MIKNIANSKHITVGEFCLKSNLTLTETLERITSRNIEVFGWCKEASSHPIISHNAIRNFLSSRSNGLQREFIVYLDSPSAHYISQKDVKTCRSSRKFKQYGDGTKYFMYKFSKPFRESELYDLLYIRNTDSLKVLIPNEATLNILYFDTTNEVIYFRSQPYLLSSIQFKLLLLINNETRSESNKYCSAKNIAAEFNRSLQNILSRSTSASSRINSLVDELIIKEPMGYRLSCYDNLVCTDLYQAK